MTARVPPYSRFLRDSTALQFSALARALGGVLSALALTHLLGARAQGEYFVAIAVASLLWFLVSFGTVSVAVSRVAAAVAAGRDAETVRWLAFLARASALTGGAVGAVALVVAPWLTALLGGEPRVAAWAAALAWTWLLELPRTVATAALQGTRRMGALARLEIAHEAVRVFLVVLGAMATGSPTGPVAGSLAASTLSSVLALGAYSAQRRRAGGTLPTVAEVARAVPSAPLGDGLREGLRLGLVRNTNVVARDVLPALLLARFGRAEWVAYLRIAQRVAQTAMAFAQATSRTALAALSGLAAGGEVARMRRTFVRASLLGASTVSGAYLAALAALPWVLEWVVPADYRGPVWRNCWILLPGLALTSFATVTEAFYVATGTLGAALRLTLGGLAVQGGVMGTLAWWDPERGAVWGVSAAMAWNLVHAVHAWRWLRRRSRYSG